MLKGESPYRLMLPTGLLCGVPPPRRVVPQCHTSLPMTMCQSSVSFAGVAGPYLDERGVDKYAILDVELKNSRRGQIMVDRSGRGLASGRVRCRGCNKSMARAAPRNRDYQGRSWHYDCLACSLGASWTNRAKVDSAGAPITRKLRTRKQVGRLMPLVFGLKGGRAAETQRLLDDFFMECVDG